MSDSAEIQAAAIAEARYVQISSHPSRTPLLWDFSIVIFANCCLYAALSTSPGSAWCHPCTHWQSNDLRNLALFSYDYLITLGSELALFWIPRRVNGALILFLLNRYLMMTVQILGLALPESLSLQVCCIDVFTDTMLMSHCAEVQ